RYYELESVASDDAIRFPGRVNINGHYSTANDNAPTSGKLGFLAQQGQREVSVLNYDGSYNFVNLGDISNEKQAGDLSGKLKASGAVLVPLNGLQETGYWNPTVVTDKSGKATVVLTVPE